MEGEAAESTDLDTIAGRQRLAHLFKHTFDGKLYIAVREVALFLGDDIDQFGLCHSSLIPC